MRAGRGSLLSAEEQRAARERNRAADARAKELSSAADARAKELSAVQALGLSVYSDESESESDDAETAVAAAVTAAATSAAAAVAAAVAAAPDVPLDEEDSDLVALIDALDAELASTASAGARRGTSTVDQKADLASESAAEPDLTDTVGVLQARLAAARSVAAGDAAQRQQLDRLHGEIDARFTDWSIGAMTTSFFTQRLAAMALRVGELTTSVLPLPPPPLLPCWAGRRSAPVADGGAEAAGEEAEHDDECRECLLFACAATPPATAPPSRFAIAMLTRSGGQRRIALLRPPATTSTATTSSASAALEDPNAVRCAYYIAHFAGADLARDVLRALAPRRSAAAEASVPVDGKWCRVGTHTFARRLTRSDPRALLAADGGAAGSYAFFYEEQDVEGVRFTRASTTLSEIEAAHLPAPSEIRAAMVAAAAAAKTQVCPPLPGPAIGADAETAPSAAAAAAPALPPPPSGKRVRSADSGAGAGASKKQRSTKSKKSKSSKSKSAGASSSATMPKKLASLQEKWKAAAVLAQKEDAPRTLAEIEAAEAATIAEWKESGGDRTASANPNFAPLGGGGGGGEATT